MNRKRILQFLNKYRRVICFGLVLWILLWLVRGNVTVGVTHYDLYRDRIPSEFNGFRIAQISDLHNASFGKDNAALLRLLKKERPGIIVITGDMIDKDHTDVERAVAFAEEAVKIAPCYYVTGNHEAWVGDPCMELEKGLEACGVKVLKNEKVLLRKGRGVIELYGVEDPSRIYKALGTDNVKDTVRAAMEGLISASSRYKILLCHRPEALEVYDEQRMDLVFSGHYHGGQLRLPLVGGLIGPGMELFPTYDGGIYNTGRTTMVVSRGLGNSVIPVRLANRPELVIATLRSVI